MKEMEQRISGSSSQYEKAIKAMNVCVVTSFEFLSDSNVKEKDVRNVDAINSYFCWSLLFVLFHRYFLLILVTLAVQ